jgi:hypothetical protein
MQRRMLKYLRIAVTALSLTAWLLLLGYGLSRYLAPIEPDITGDPNPLPDYGRIMWIVWSFWLGVGLAVTNSIMAWRHNKYWRAAAIAPAAVSGIVLMLLMVASL